MAFMIDRLQRLDQRLPVSEERAATRHTLPYSGSTIVEQFLLLTSVVMLPLQDYFPTVAGMSSSFLLFSVIAVYVIVNRPRTLGKIWYHPVFIAAYAFIVVSVLLEYSSPQSTYSETRRFVEMIGGAVCVAALCRDRSALAACLYGYIAAALWVSVVLYLTSYGMLQGMGAVGDFHEAEKVRAEAFGNKPVAANINTLSVVCAQGTIVALALCLSDRWKRLRGPLLGIVAFCLIASFLPMSRGTVMMSFVAFAAIFYARGEGHGKQIIIAAVLGIAIYMLVPEAVWSRMTFSTDVRESGKMESRAHLYTTALNRLPEYIVAGVGAGNFYQKWGVDKGFSRNIYSDDGRSSIQIAMGVHNALLQITIFWGVLGLSMFLWIIWGVYRSIPLRCGLDEFSLALLGIIISLGIYLLLGHNFSHKSFSLGLGMLVGARQWIWPRGIVSAVEVDRYTSGPNININSDRRSR